MAATLFTADTSGLTTVSDSVIEALENELREHGGRDYVLNLVANPDWSDEWEYRHDWRIDVPPSIRPIWAMLSVETKLIAYLMAVRSESNC